MPASKKQRNSPITEWLNKPAIIKVIMPKNKTNNSNFLRPYLSLSTPSGIWVIKLPPEKAGIMMDTAVKSSPERKA